MINKIMAVLVLLVGIAAPTSAQIETTGKVFADLFVGPDGDVIYPQYTFEVKTGAGNITGYGFLERAPGEPLFTNHVNTFAPKGITSVLRVRTETGGAPGNSFYFFQVGPQVQLHEAVPVLKKAMGYVVLGYLPSLAGPRPSNTILAGGTRTFRPSGGLEISAEGFRRFFGNGGADYAEYWVLIHPTRLRHVSFAGFLLQDGGTRSLAFGARISQ